MLKGNGILRRSRESTWIAHIESSQSFVRKMAYYWWKNSPQHAHEIHFGIDYLIKLGYTPKWLDEFK